MENVFVELNLTRRHYTNLDVGIKMAAVHFITIPCEPYTAINYKESPIFKIFVPLLRKHRKLGLKM